MRIYLNNGAKQYAFEVATPEGIKAEVNFPVLFIKAGIKGFFEGSTPDESIPPEVAESAVAAARFGWHTKAAALALAHLNAQSGK